MKFKKPIFASIGFVILTFIIAPLWHITLFGKQYQLTGLYLGEPNYFVGITIFVIQAGLLSFGFDFLYSRLKISAFKFVGYLGIFLWTMQVLAILAKHQMVNALWFFIMESLFMVIQLGLFYIILKVIYKNK